MSNNNQKSNGGIGSFLVDHARTLISILIIVLLIGTGIYAYTKNNTSSQNSSEEESLSITDKIRDIVGGENSKDETKPEETDQNQQPDVMDLVVDNGTASQEILEGSVKDGRIYSYKAELGNGVTHLARKAVDEYLKENSNNKVAIAQKIFMETRLKDMYYKANLSLNEEISFTPDDLSQVLKEAENLSPKQVEAWSAYVHLVPSLK